MKADGAVTSPAARSPAGAAAPGSGGAGEASDDAVVAVVSLYQKQQKIYARAVSGWFAGWRWALVWFTQLLFYGLPWLEWNARQAVLFDLGARRFYIFNLVLYPQDFIYLTGLLIISAYALFLFTAVAGRLWCGYACPQTVYTEIFMWIERRIEGDRNARMKLDAGPWNLNRLWRKTAKQGVWIGLGLWTGLTFVGYFTPIRELIPKFTTFGLGPWESFWVLFYGFATYGSAGYMREQVCKYMCPYARFQSAMFDKDTLIISYDEQRGDPRGTRSRKIDARAQGLGDCIDCGLCVQVCPTGIDIRNGLQYECIGCTACIDVCNGVMDKMKYPRGLIRYTSQNGLAAGATWPELLRRTLRPRVLVYALILALIVGAWAASIATRAPLRVDVVRDRASLARLVEAGWIENVYRLQLMNLTEQPRRYTVRAEGLDGLVVTAEPGYDLEPAGARWVTIALRVPPETADSVGAGAHGVRFIVEADSVGSPGGDATAARTPRPVIESSTFIVPR
jgi:cytochrome c oxidase accessory protein FixG